MKRSIIRFFMASTAVALACCTRAEIPTEAPPPATAVTAVSPAAPASPQVSVVDTSLAEKRSSACPAGMLEVAGEHCANVAHLCIEGREVVWSEPDEKSKLRFIKGTSPVHCPQGCPTPYFCDKFVPDHAVCSGARKNLRFCVDDYEYPGTIGEKPRVMVSWREARSLCEARGKRLCGDDEWMLACEGPGHRPYPYGWERDPTACNIDKPQREGGVNQKALGSKIASVRDAEVTRLDQREPIGSSPRCLSQYGVHDMTGNVDEWTVNVTHGGKPHQSLFKGGHWVGGARNRCRPDTDSHNEDFAFYAEGFRCCADVK